MLNDQDKKRFLMALTKTKVSLPGVTLSREEEAIRIDVFWEELHGYPIEQVEEAFRWARGSLAFFPKPVELTDHIAEEAKLKYLRSQPKKIEWMEPSEEGELLAHKTVSELFGRWKKEDEQRERDRAERFEKNRENLKKQTRLLKK